MTIELTTPQLFDFKEYHSLIIQSDWQNEFINMKGQSIIETKKEISDWVLKKNELFPSILRFIKYNDKLIGFIANTPAGYDDELKSGFKMLLNYAISKEYESRGVMSTALNLFLQEMYDFEFNIVSAFVKPGNIGSERVLEKNGFDLVRDHGLGKSYVKALKIDMTKYKQAFGL